MWASFSRSRSRCCWILFFSCWPQQKFILVLFFWLRSFYSTFFLFFGLKYEIAWLKCSNLFTPLFDHCQKVIAATIWLKQSENKNKTKIVVFFRLQKREWNILLEHCTIVDCLTYLVCHSHRRKWIKFYKWFATVIVHINASAYHLC